MSRMTSRRAYFSLLASAAAVTVLTGCGTAADESRDWRAIDICGLAEPGEVAKVDHSKSPDEAARPEPSKSDTSHGCSWGDFLVVTLKDRPAVDHVSPYFVRDIEIDGRTAAVNYQRGGDCDVWLRYRDAEMGIHIDPAASKTDVDLDDTSAISCDVQMPLLTSIVSRVDLP